MLKISIASLLLAFFLNACNSSDEDTSDEDGYVGSSQCLDRLHKQINDEPFEPFSEVEKFAVITNSNGKTHVHLNSIGLYCSSNVRIKASQAIDTLKLEEYWPDEGSLVTACSCNSSWDLTLNLPYESTGKSIKYVVYTYTHGDNLVFPVIRE